MEARVVNISIRSDCIVYIQCLSAEHGSVIQSFDPLIDLPAGLEEGGKGGDDGIDGEGPERVG